MSEIKKSKQRQRPLSPHLGHYKLPITALTSITHRITGVFLLLGCGFFVYWLLVLSKGAVAYENFEAVRSNFFVKFVILAWAGALFFHIMSGLRHIFWDFGFGFELSTVQRISWTIFTVATLATAAFALKIFG